MPMPLAHCVMDRTDAVKVRQKIFTYSSGGFKEGGGGAGAAPTPWATD